MGIHEIFHVNRELNYVAIYLPNVSESSGYIRKYVFGLMWNTAI